MRTKNAWSLSTQPPSRRLLRRKRARRGRFVLSPFQLFNKKNKNHWLYAAFHRRWRSGLNERARRPRRLRTPWTWRIRRKRNRWKSKRKTLQTLSHCYFFIFFILFLVFTRKQGFWKARRRMLRTSLQSEAQGSVSVDLRAWKEGSRSSILEWKRTCELRKKQTLKIRARVKKEKRLEGERDSIY